MSLNKCTYFIHFTFTTHDSRGGDGNIDISSSSEFNSIDNIRKVEKLLKHRYDYATLVITNFIKLPRRNYRKGALK